MAKAGDIEIKTLKISSPRGTVDLMNDPSHKRVYLNNFNAYESILDHHTHGDLTVLDPNDVLGQYMFSGDETVEAEIGVPGGSNPAKFKFAMLQNTDQKHHGSVKAKSYKFHMVTKEFLTSQSKVVEKSWNNKPTSDMVKDIIKDYWDSKDEIDAEETKPQRFAGNSHDPHTVLDKLKERHVHKDTDNSSNFLLFRSRSKSGEPNHVFKSLDTLMQNKSSISGVYKQNYGIAADTSSTGDDIWTMTALNLPHTFDTVPRYSAASNRSTYCIASGKHQSNNINSEDLNKKFKFGDSQDPISKQIYKEVDGVKEKQKPLRHVLVDKANDKEKTGIADMHVNKAASLARFSNDLGSMKVPYHPDLRVGEVITIDISQQGDSSNSKESKQITADVLIVNLRHSIGMMNDAQRGECIVEFMKAGYKEKVG